MNLVSKTLNYLWLHLWQYRANERQHRRLVQQLRKAHRPLKVVFMAIDVAYWRYQHVYELMQNDSRFRPTIVLSPCIGHEHQEQEMERLRQYFDARGISYVDYDFNAEPYCVREEIYPDIVFFPQPYEHLLCKAHDCLNFYDRLTCYMPYGFWISTGKLSYNMHFHNRAWRIYHCTGLHLKEAQRVATNHGRNVRIVGYANADDFLRPHHDDPWRPSGNVKRIVWAPHFSIVSSSSTLPPRSNFLWMAELMVTLAKEYEGRIQIAFKPHPALLTQLYQHPDWGQERTDRYYDLWRTMPNTQLETGEFIDLFMTSDAMIHDSGSFVVEYHYTKNPAMFVSKDMRPILESLTDFGKEAHNIHYIGASEADIRRFIDEVVLQDHDPMRPQREQFFRDYLLPPGGKSVAQNVVDDIVESLNLEQ
jgi:hypothetical protein